MNSTPPGPEQATSLRWLSRDYRVLRTQPEGSPAIDVLVVGSGYGGAMAAAELAGRQVRGEDGTMRAARVCVLERGREYAPGMFASSLQELPTHLRVHRGGQDQTLGPLDALLDVRLGPDVCALVGNGLGGTSLINAGVMVAPRLDDCDRLPAALRRDLCASDFAQVKARLGATDGLARRTDLPEGGLRKTRALEELARGAGKNAQNKGLDFRLADITVQMQADAADPDVPPCTLCGDCMTGCNVGAKKSLDTTLLREAWRRGAEIYTGGSVLEVRRPGGNQGQPADEAGWLVKTVYTDESLRHRHEPCWLRVRHVILAAGTLGSTEILLRSQSFRLSLSQQLGEQFSCNGDNLVALHDGPDPVHATSEESVPLRNRQVGPTITAMVDLDGMLVQEFAVPAPLKRLFDEAVTTARLFQDLGKPPERSDARGDGCDSFQPNPGAMENTLLLGLIGHDESCGQLLLSEPARMEANRQREGRVRIRWPGVRNSFMLDRGFEIAHTLVRKSRGEEAPFLPNPAWRLLPESMEFLVHGERGPVLTVHPLGGCPMGETFRHGVVDDQGRVFDRAACEQALAAGAADGGTRVHHGLAVLDGSIIPASLGANPALMIATVARRAARLLAVQWGLEDAGAPLKPLGPRPVFRPPEHCTPDVPQPTEVQLTERLVGRAGGKLLELTLRYAPATVQDLMSARRPRLQVDGAASRLRVYDGGADTQRQLITWSEQTREERAELVATVGGELDMLRQRPGDTLATAQALWHWFRNRGSRELWDSTIARTQPQTLEPAQLWASGARAAEARLFDYRITVGALEKGNTGLLQPGDVIAGQKRLTYGLCSNPWRQLREMRLTQFPRTLGPGVLHLDCRFLARQGYPLLRITRQQNQVTALAELASWGAAWLRMLASIHLWSFRAPDPAPVRTANLLPSPKRTRLPAPEISEIELEPPRRGVPVRMRLTRYPGDGRPIALIHGYSASGTTFTHDAIPKPLALHLLERGHDVWVLDLRTSAGMPSAILPWHFEDAALADLPLAVAHIRRVTRAPEVDVFAHCIGAVMLGMALLADPKDLSSYDREAADGGLRPPRCRDELAALRGSLGGVVLSQKAPLLVYSDDNVLRAYFMRLLRHVLLPEDYRFTVPTGQQGIAGGLLDRILSTMPYPDDDFRRENPFLPPWKRAPWAGFRHRMDALYACDFKLANLEERTLGAIADLFGPLNLDTVAQAIHFARFNTVTDASGRAIDTRAATLRARWPERGTLSLHGTENGLVDVATLDVFAAAMARAGVPLEVRRIPGYGHQDCLIGRHAQHDVFRHVSTFLGDPHDPHFRPRPPVAVADRGPERQG